MFWKDILLEKTPSKIELINALSIVFNIRSNRILVVKSLDDSEITETIGILCQTLVSSEVYSLRLSLFIRDGTINFDDDLSIVGHLCELLKCSAVISDKSVNPNSMWLIRSRTSVEPIFIDLEKYDNAQEYEML